MLFVGMPEFQRKRLACKSGDCDSGSIVGGFYIPIGSALGDEVIESDRVAAVLVSTLPHRIHYDDLRSISIADFNLNFCITRPHAGYIGWTAGIFGNGDKFYPDAAV